jgi:hypothetical protein
MKRHLVSLIFFATALSSNAQTVISDPEHRAKYEAALKDAARYKAEQQYYENWVKALTCVKTAADWYADKEAKIGAFIADQYDKYTAPKFEDNPAGYEAQRQYYEAFAQSLQPLELPAKVVKVSSDLAAAKLDPLGAAGGLTYLTVTDPDLEKNAKEVLSTAQKIAASMAVVSGGPKQESTMANSTPVLLGQVASDWGGTTSRNVQVTNSTQAWGSQNNGSWQCTPSQWNSQNSPVAWPKN